MRMLGAAKLISNAIPFRFLYHKQYICKRGFIHQGLDIISKALLLTVHVYWQGCNISACVLVRVLILHQNIDASFYPSYTPLWLARTCVKV